MVGGRGLAVANIDWTGYGAGRGHNLLDRGWRRRQMLPTTTSSVVALSFVGVVSDDAAADDGALDSWDIVFGAANLGGLGKHLEALGLSNG